MRKQSSEDKACSGKPASRKLRSGLSASLTAAALFVVSHGVASAASFATPVALATNDLGGYWPGGLRDARTNSLGSAGGVDQQ